MTSILAKFAPSIEALVLSGEMRILEEKVGAGFGDALVMLDAGGFKLCLVRDRSDLSLEVCHEKEHEWYPLEYALEFMHQSPISPSPDAVPHYLPSLRQMLATGTVQSGFAAFVAQKRADVLNRYKAKR